MARWMGCQGERQGVRARSQAQTAGVGLVYPGKPGTLDPMKFPFSEPPSQ